MTGHDPRENLRGLTLDELEAFVELSFYNIVCALELIEEKKEES